jgi:hypothetical protein
VLGLRLGLVRRIASLVFRNVQFRTLQRVQKKGIVPKLNVIIGEEDTFEYDLIVVVDRFTIHTVLKQWRQLKPGSFVLSDNEGTIRNKTYKKTIGNKT